MEDKSTCENKGFRKFYVILEGKAFDVITKNSNLLSNLSFLLTLSSGVLGKELTFD